MEYFNEDERATTGPNNMDKSNIMWTEISHLPKNSFCLFICMK